MLANFSGDDLAVPDLPGQPDWAGAELVIGNYAPPAGEGNGEVGGHVDGADGPTLRPWEARVYRRTT